MHSCSAQILTNIPVNHATVYVVTKAVLFPTCSIGKTSIWRALLRFGSALWCPIYHARPTKASDPVIGLGLVLWCPTQHARPTKASDPVMGLGFALWCHMYHAKPTQAYAPVTGLRAAQVRYREDLDLVLKGLSLSIKPREKIGIVGRTGCGKSTLMSTLFRIVEPTGGRVMIDGHDLAQVPLHQLRSQLALVPQVRTATNPHSHTHTCTINNVTVVKMGGNANMHINFISFKNICCI